MARTPSYITQPSFVSDSFVPSRVDRPTIPVWLRLWILVGPLAGCGPPLNEPSAVNLTGRWVSTDRIGTLFNIEVTINQAPDGAITGTWVSDVSPPHPPCPPDIGDKGVGTVAGNNVAIGVQLSLLGAGDFQGQSTGRGGMRGSFQSCGLTVPISFALAGPSPTG
jgi:hypothetical protein